MSTLNTIYRGMAQSNFSHDVLERTNRLAVVTVDGSGWSDWGSPDRVLRDLGATQPDEIRLAV